MLTSLCANVFVHISKDIVACFSAHHCNGITKSIKIRRDHSSTPLARINILKIWARVSLSLALIVSVFTVSFSGGQRCELSHGVAFGPVIAFGNKVHSFFPARTTLWTFAYSVFWPSHRLWKQGSDTCRQALRERNVGPYTIRDRSLSSTRFNMLY